MDPRRWLLAIASLAVVCTIVGCRAPDEAKLGIDNGTTLAVTVVVNGVNVGTVAPQRQLFLDGASLPPMPWSVQALSPTGRVLVRLFAPIGSVTSTQEADGRSGQSGVGARVDLSCGRLDVYAGPPMLGPAPGPGQPGDCAP